MTLNESLEEAVSAGDPGLVRRLLSQGANPNYVRSAYVIHGGVAYRTFHADGTPMVEEDPEAVAVELDEGEDDAVAVVDKVEVEDDDRVELAVLLPEGD